MKTTEVVIVYGDRYSNGKWRPGTTSKVTIGIVNSDFCKEAVEKEVRRALANLEVTIANKESPSEEG